MKDLTLELFNRRRKAQMFSNAINGWLLDQLYGSGHIAYILPAFCFLAFTSRYIPKLFIWLMRKRIGAGDKFRASVRR